jgi:hypothetical protein
VEFARERDDVDERTVAPDRDVNAAVDGVLHPKFLHRGQRARSMDPWRGPFLLERSRKYKLTACGRNRERGPAGWTKRATHAANIKRTFFCEGCDLPTSKFPISLDVSGENLLNPWEILSAT